jgi:hypothetical protein
MFMLLQGLGRGVVKVAISLGAGGGVTLLAMGGLAMLEPDRWDHHMLERIGPPIGPTLLSVGAGLAAAAGSLYTLFFPTTLQAVRDGRWPVVEAAGPGRGA